MWGGAAAAPHSSSCDACCCRLVLAPCPRRASSCCTRAARRCSVLAGGWAAGGRRLPLPPPLAAVGSPRLPASPVASGGACGRVIGCGRGSAARLVAPPPPSRPSPALRCLAWVGRVALSLGGPNAGIGAPGSGGGSARVTPTCLSCAQAAGQKHAVQATCNELRPGTPEEPSKSVRRMPPPQPPPPQPPPPATGSAHYTLWALEVHGRRGGAWRGLWCAATRACGMSRRRGARRGRQ